MYLIANLVYRVKGYDKKLMSDKHIGVKGGKEYHLSFRFKSKENVIIHAGVACFDGGRNLIAPVQV